MQLHVAVIVLVFLLTYLGMAAGRLPGLQVDRTGIALLGVIALLATESVTLDSLGGDIDTSTLVLLFALMIVSAQFLSSGFFDLAADWITGRRGGAARLLATTVAVCGGFGALLANDIVTFTMAPLLVAGARSRGLDPRPFLLALACATNAGSAATLIGNPQNILIGQVGNLSFHTYLLASLVPSVVALVCVFGVIWLIWHDRIEGTVLAVTREAPEVPAHPHDRNQTLKGLVAMAALLILFMTSWPRETGGLVIAALLLATRKFTSRIMIAAVDWPLLLLFVCLFAVTGALNNETTLPSTIMSWLQDVGLLPDSLAVLTPVTLFMSNIFGNVPSVILLMKLWSDPPQGPLYALALLSSLAGNLLLVGSLSNLIVIERGAAFGVRIGFAEYARVGVPITLLSMGFAVFWLALTGWLPLLPGGDAP
jgi:Na+/H+ antiporter NhaD/arsenite permease-like protein